MSTRIYTKTGDDGTTGLFGGARIRKDDIRLETYGTVDELNAFVGLAATEVADQHLRERLFQIQSLLFVLGADLATPLDVRTTYTIPRIEQGDVSQLEQWIDEIENSLDELKNFILPGGSKSAAYLHVCRTVCRRAERLLVSLSDYQQVGEYDLVFLNRLSDLFFVLARRVNVLEGEPDIEWRGREPR